MKKIGLFVDVQNIYYTTREAYGKQFNYRELWRRVSQNNCIAVANAYAIAHQDDQQHKFQSALKHIGFNVKVKPYIQRRDGSAKGDWDVGITIDILKSAQNLDGVILLSGDGDFDILIQTIRQDYQVSADVFGVEKLTANSLIESASHFYPIDRSLLLA
ncbi:LabA-like NYN domain-containing protein [Aliikangiella sp. IMCC44653]